MKHVRLLAAAAAVSLAIAAPASADPFRFFITGDYNADFILDSSPTPDDVISGSYFTLWDVPGFPDAFFNVADISFFTAAAGGGMEIADFYGGSILLVTDGDQLFTGTVDTPTFKLGTFALTEYLGTGTYSLTISEVGSGAVPEPAAWGMLIGGFGLAGAAMRRRGYAKGKTKVSFAA